MKKTTQNRYFGIGKPIVAILVVCVLIFLGYKYIGGRQSADSGEGTSAPTSSEGSTIQVTTDTDASEPSETEPASTAAPTTEALSEGERLQALKDGIDVKALKPDELGKGMVIMYHTLIDKNSAYSRTVASFKQDLERLYNLGFRTVSMQDFIAGTFDLPAGCIPIVLTFDDGHISNFKYIEDASGNLTIDPDCVVGILNAFNEAHPDFGRAAIFYLNGGTSPFGQPDLLEKKLAYLRENGYEIGNHSLTHDYLNKLGAAGIQKELGANYNLFRKMAPDMSFNSLALPFGLAPKDEALRKYIVTGVYDDITYRNDAILAVGGGPTIPSYHVKYDFTRVKRVQSGDDLQQLTWWLDAFEESSKGYYVSDGVPEVITIPKEKADEIDLTRVNPDAVYVYESGEN